jgi:protein-arginine kinase activator protein McsA
MLCPRCDKDEARVMVKSPVGDVWEVYVCDNCKFSWRSTETIKILPQFKLDDHKIATMMAIPPIPPLKK